MGHRVRAVLLATAIGLAALTGSLAGPLADASAAQSSFDPCPCDNPVCRPLC